MEAHDKPGFPQGPLLAAGALVAISLVAVAAARLLDFKVPLPASTGSLVSSRELLIDDAAAGSVTVRDAGSGREIARLPSGSDGFLRATMRGLARDRRARGIGAEVPFRLLAYADGALVLEDPATGRTVALAAFGPTNAAAFARFIHEPASLAAGREPASRTP